MSIKTQSIIGVMKKEGRQPEESSFWFTATNEIRPFHCLNCGRFQFNRHHRVVAVLEDDFTPILLVPPISPQCARCGFIFNLHIF